MHSTLDDHVVEKLKSGVMIEQNESSRLGNNFQVDRTTRNITQVISMYWDYVLC